MSESAATTDIHSKSFKTAELRSEWVRVATLLGVFAGFLALIAARASLSWAQGHRGEAWPFALLLAAITIYEVLWLRAVKHTLALGQTVSRGRWTTNLLVESLLPTIALLLQVHTPAFGPERTLTSPVVLVYFVLTILATLHLDPTLARLAGVFSSAGYALVAAYIFLQYPEIAARDPLVVYFSSLSIAVLLLVGGFAAGAVARQIQQHVLAALLDAEHRAQIARFEHDLGTARSIQQGLLPTTPPIIAGYDIAGWNQPADETGGDYYDWQLLADGRVGFILADVTGHGIGPALIMAACRAYARAGLALENDLKSFLHRMNRLLNADLPPAKFVTFAAGVIAEDATGQLISAGHGPMLFYSSAADSFQALDAQGLPLGLMPGATYGSARALKFERGDMLVLVTDGMVEWPNAGDEDFGVNRLQEVIRANRDEPAARIISAMRSAVMTFGAEVQQPDDLTALVVKKV
jgi:serine phosphatase RsbU (regulator of sigma subunit)